MEKFAFEQWLVEERGLTGKAARDAASRSKRIELILGRKLDKAAVSQASYDLAIKELAKTHPCRGDLMYAIRLYVAFSNPKIDTRKYGFYGQSSVKSRLG